MENTIYGLFQETVNKYMDDVAIIEDKKRRGENKTGKWVVIS